MTGSKEVRVMAFYHSQSEIGEGRVLMAAIRDVLVFLCTLGMIDSSKWPSSRPSSRA